MCINYRPTFHVHGTTAITLPEILLKCICVLCIKLQKNTNTVTNPAGENPNHCRSEGREAGNKDHSPRQRQKRSDGLCLVSTSKM